MAALTLYGALAVVLLVGVSRLYLGVHYLSDVLAAYAAGAAWLLLCIHAVSLRGVWPGPRGQPPSTVASAA
jgi:membrane-associated phospholipid phosphatase